MASPPARRRPPTRWQLLFVSRRFWLVVGSTIVAALAIYGLVAVPVGPQSFSFGISSGNCNCERGAFTNHSFPDAAFVSMTFSSHYYGAAAEYILLVTDPSGGLIIYAPMQTGYSSDNFTGNGINYANVSESFSTGAGGAFEFEILGTDPTLLPLIIAWVNGTYHAPILS